LGTVLLALAAILAFARVYVGTHYPGDVFAGALLGMIVASALFLLAPSRRLVELVAARVGQVWDRALIRLPGSARTSA
jgi:undecaprenyl-diphosphatase